MPSRARVHVDTTDRGYATATDFCRIFKDEMGSMCLLALILTGSREKAEQCFVAGLEDSIEGNPVFKEWADSWARRNLIKNAIRTVFSTGGNDQPIADELARDSNPVIATVTRLAPMERFVFVMTVLEGYADRDCAALLNCTREGVANARIRAMGALSRIVPLTPGFDLGQSDREQHRSSPSRPQFAPESEVWWREHAVSTGTKAAATGCDTASPAVTSRAQTLEFR